MTTSITQPISIPNSYPIFMPNQVLTDKALNGLVTYLDSQARLTRTHLIGMGIVGGLAVKVIEPETVEQENEVNVKITSGGGLTSVGDLIVLPEELPTPDQDEREPEQDEGESEKATILSHYKELTESENLISEALFFDRVQSLDNGQTETYRVIELFRKPVASKATTSTPETVVSDLKKITTTTLADKVLVVVHESQDKQQDLCYLDADNQGIQRNSRLRFFLLRRDMSQETSEVDPPNAKHYLSAERLLRTGYQMDKLQAPWKNVSTAEPVAADQAEDFFLTTEVLTARSTFLKDYMPKLYRFGYNEAEKTVDLTKIDDYTSFKDNYELICTKAITKILETFPKLFHLFSPFFTSFQPDILEDFTGLKATLETALEQSKVGYGLQYFYDYLSILVQAYEELVIAAFDLMEDFPPNNLRFPNFLMLAEFSSEGEPPVDPSVPLSAYRSYFTQPPLYNGNQLRLNQVRHLYRRLRLLCQPDSFSLEVIDENQELKITPSKDRSHYLSQQAIPYYLNYDNIYQYWNYDAYRKRRSASVPAYFMPEENDETILVYRLDDYNFYRVEGHISKELTALEQEIKDYRQQFNLAFDICFLELLPRQVSSPISEGTSAANPSVGDRQLFHEFTEQHPGMEHLGGVPHGGTLILVYANIVELLGPLLQGGASVTSSQQNGPNTFSTASSILMEPGLPQGMATIALPKSLTSIITGPISLPFVINFSWLIEFRAWLFSFQENPNRIIADFYLPYRCCDMSTSDEDNGGDHGGEGLQLEFAVSEETSPSVEEQITLSLGKANFCEKDTTRYQFTLAPAGGDLEGEGIIQEHDQYYFKPSLLGVIPHRQEITFTYRINDAHRSLTATVYPLPDATFIISDGSSNHFSITDGLLALTPDQTGGNFKVWQEPAESEQPQEIPDAIFFLGGQFFFNPSAVQPNEGASKRVKIEHTVTNEADCTTQLAIPVTITASPVEPPPVV
jgi:hypothetical protein